MADENYLDIDFNTFISRMKDILRSTDTFKDYNFEGANISILLELMAYQTELNTYYQNKIAKNVYLDSADLYDTVHRLARQKGYYPKGYISSFNTLTVSISGGYSPGDQIYVPSYTSFSTEDGVQYLTTTDTTINIPSSASAVSYDIELDVKEGELLTLNYTAEDLIDYKLILPSENFDHDINDANNHESIKVLINGVKWTRLENFYENLSSVDLDENVYTFNFTKDKEYDVSFTTTRNYPKDVDSITIYTLISQGEDGVVGSNTITESDSDFIENITNGNTISNDNISITNPLVSSNGSDPEVIDTIKENANNIFNSQYRCVTKNDFKTYLETRSDVMAASVWGEQEETEEGNVQEYNKVHISIIPDEWKSSTISRTISGWVPTWSDDGEPVNIYIPEEFSSTFKTTLSKFIEPRSIIIRFPEYELPELVYFYMDLGIRIKSTYNFANVARDVRNKLIYYFHPMNRNFNEIIDFRDIINYIKDSTKQSSSDSFSGVKGINSITFRDLYLNTNIHDYESKSYPRYKMSDFDINIDNALRPIELGFKQFPSTTEDLIVIRNEG